MSGLVLPCDNLSYHPAFKFADKAFIVEVLANYVSQKYMKCRKVMSYCHITRALPEHNVYCFPIMLRQRRALLRIGGLSTLLICRLMRFNCKYASNGPHYADCIILRQHSQVTKNHAKTLFLQGKYFYEKRLFSEAAKSWGKAAMLQHTASHAFLSNMLFEGRHDVLKDEKLAFELASAGVALGCTHSKGVLGCCYASGEGVDQDEAKGLELGRVSAAAGSCFGQYVVGKCYECGLGVKEDNIEAMKWLRLASEKGHAYAQGNLGNMFRDGRGVAQDYAEAVRLYRLAAGQGDVTAQYNLGRMCSMGIGMKKDYTEALYWLRLAAEQGNFAAQQQLSYMFEYGKGVVINRVEAARWARLASANMREARLAEESRCKGLYST
jgi:TPR repeat protein